MRLFEIVVDTGIQIWNANEVNGIEFPVKTPLLPFLPLEPNITTTETAATTTAALETVCTELCEGLADGTFISDGCCSPTFCICPYPVEQSCSEDDVSYKQGTTSTPSEMTTATSITAMISTRTNAISTYQQKALKYVKIEEDNEEFSMTTNDQEITITYTPGQDCLPYDGSVVPDCSKYIDPVKKEPYYKEHSSSK